MLFYGAVDGYGHNEQRDVRSTVTQETSFSLLQVTGVAITSGGMRGVLVTCSLDHTARVYDLATGRQVYNLVTAAPLTAVTANTLGSQVFLGNNGGHVSVVNLLPPPPPGDVQVRVYY